MTLARHAVDAAPCGVFGAVLPLLSLLSVASPCPRLCLAPVATVGLDDDERGVVDAAMARALQAPLCRADQAPAIDDACHADDACLQRQQRSGAGFISVRAVRAGSSLRVAYAAVRPDGVTRGEQVEPALAFLANGALPESIAAVPCAAGDAPAAVGASTQDPRQAATLVEMPAAWVAVTGASVLTVTSTAALVAALSALEVPQLGGSAKEAAVVVGWAAVAGVVVGGGALGAALWWALGSDDDQVPPAR